MLEETYQQLNQILTHPHLLNNPHNLPKYSKHHPQLQKTLHLYPHYKQTKQHISQLQQILPHTKHNHQIQMFKDEH
ncbi:PCRF domain-containing protein, partial [Staphylococcus saprophyticus]|uniref:PCRF domain-containing protein n=1 Tax=Staphylococcus saprophyticus TaxID=29385 RepID=UPI0037037914